MPTIEYEIKLNDEGRPCIDLPPTYQQIPENQFFVLEMARYVLQKSHAGMKVPPFDQETVDTVDVSIRMIGQISDEVARILWHSMKAQADLTFDMGQKFHVICDSIEERDSISDKGILYQEKLYLRQEGLKVLVRGEKYTVYELRNDNWVEL